MIQTLLPYLLLLGAGFLAGALNVIAGGGSLLTIPILIFLGLPATVANGTNRVAILMQNVSAVWGFSRYGISVGSWMKVAALPMILGAAVGTAMGIWISDTSYQRLLAIVMVGVALITVWKPLGGGDAAESSPADLPVARKVLLLGGFFLAGIYGGFIQAGLGFVLLAITTAFGLDLVRGNALKVFLVLAYTPVALAGYALAGKVDWGLGLALAVGNFSGAQVGVHLAVLRGHTWIRRVVTVTVILFAIRLLWTA
jgi:uncharacterized membrane protein YfcA